MPEEKKSETPVPVAVEKPVAEASAVAAPAVKKPAVAKAAAAKSAAPKLSRLEETKAKNKKALAEALAMAQAVQIAQPPKLPAAPAAKPAKAAKARKPKLVRHAFSMQEVEYAQLAALKKRIASLGGDVKRSELMRAGLAFCRLGAVASGEAEPPAVGFKYLEQGFALHDNGAALRRTLSMGERAAQGRLEIAARIAGRQCPKLAATFMQVRPGFQLAGLRVSQARIVGNHRASRMGGRYHKGEQGEG